MPPSVPHEQLLAAARRTLAREGYARATLDRIAVEAGVSRVTLHRRGITKDGLLAELVEQAAEDLRRRLWPALTAGGSGAERLANALEALCGAAEEHLELLVMLRAQGDRIFHEHGTQPAFTRDVFVAPFERLLRDGAADGTLDVDDPEEAATAVFNLVGWTYVHLRAGHGWEPDRARRAVLRPVLDGLRAR